MRFIRPTSINLIQDQGHSQWCLYAWYVQKDWLKNWHIMSNIKALAMHDGWTMAARTNTTDYTDQYVTGMHKNSSSGHHKTEAPLLAVEKTPRVLFSFSVNFGWESIPGIWGKLWGCDWYICWEMTGLHHCNTPPQVHTEQKYPWLTGERTPHTPLSSCQKCEWDPAPGAWGKLGREGGEGVGEGEGGGWGYEQLLCCNMISSRHCNTKPWANIKWRVPDQNGISQACYIVEI